MSYTLSYDVVNNVPVIVGTALGANGGVNIALAIDYTAQANLIVTSLQNISANTNDVKIALQNIDANTNTIKISTENIDANLATITLVGTTNTPLQANGFITRSKWEEYNNIFFLRAIMDPNTNFANFPNPPSAQEQAALNAIQSWITAANTYIPTKDT